MNLATYMSDAIRRIMTKAYRNVLSNPWEAVWRLVAVSSTSVPMAAPSLVRSHLSATETS